jgi:hypothetical protein
MMKNITLAMDETTLKLGREYARLNGMSFNDLVRRLVEQTVQSPRSPWLQDGFSLIDRKPVSSQGKRWKREDLYRA